MHYLYSKAFINVIIIIRNKEIARECCSSLIPNLEAFRLEYHKGCIVPHCRLLGLFVFTLYWPRLYVALTESFYLLLGYYAFDTEIHCLFGYLRKKITAKVTQFQESGKHLRAKENKLRHIENGQPYGIKIKATCRLCMSKLLSPPNKMRKILI